MKNFRGFFICNYLNIITNLIPSKNVAPKRQRFFTPKK